MSAFQEPLYEIWKEVPIIIKCEEVIVAIQKSKLIKESTFFENMFSETWFSENMKSETSVKEEDSSEPPHQEFWKEKYDLSTRIIYGECIEIRGCEPDAVNLVFSLLQDPKLTCMLSLAEDNIPVLVDTIKICDYFDAKKNMDIFSGMLTGIKIEDNNYKEFIEASRLLEKIVEPISTELEKMWMTFLGPKLKSGRMCRELINLFRNDMDFVDGILQKIEDSETCEHCGYEYHFPCLNHGLEKKPDCVYCGYEIHQKCSVHGLVKKPPCKYCGYQIQQKCYNHGGDVDTNLLAFCRSCRGAKYTQTCKHCNKKYQP